LTAGWLWLSCAQRAPTCFSPSDRIRITWRRVGSLTCFRRTEARLAFWSRWSAPFWARDRPDALGVVAGFTLVLVAIRKQPPRSKTSVGVNQCARITGPDTSPRPARQNPGRRQNHYRRHDTLIYHNLGG